MVSQCANPECGAQFLYFGEGKLVAVRRQAARLEESRVEFFWLCGECATRLNLEIPSDGVPCVVPRYPSPQLLAAH